MAPAPPPQGELPPQARVAFGNDPPSSVDEPTLESPSMPSSTVFQTELPQVVRCPSYPGADSPRESSSYVARRAPRGLAAFPATPTGEVLPRVVRVRSTPVERLPRIGPVLSTATDSLLPPVVRAPSTPDRLLRVRAHTHETVGRTHSESLPSIGRASSTSDSLPPMVRGPSTADSLPAMGPEPSVVDSLPWTGASGSSVGSRDSCNLESNSEIPGQLPAWDSEQEELA